MGEGHGFQAVCCRMEHATLSRLHLLPPPASRRNVSAGMRAAYEHTVRLHANPTSGWMTTPR